MGDVVRFPSALEPWVDANAAAAHFGVSPRTIKRWADGGMPSERFGGTRRFRLSVCEAWLRKDAS